MQAFRATYTPRKYDTDTGLDIGPDKEKAENVLVLDIYPNYSGVEFVQDCVAIIRGDNSLDVVPIGCITECQWLSEETTLI